MNLIDLSADVYAWTRAFHIISIIAWMAGLLYLPRLFVYHTECDAGSQQWETLQLMEKRLFHIIMTPAMLLSLGSGLVLLFNLDSWAWTQVWIYVKLVCVVGLLASHLLMGSWQRAFAENRNRFSQTFYRTMNEVPTFLMIVIVISVVVRPF